MSLNFNPKEGLIVVPTCLFGPTGDTIVHLALDTGATEYARIFPLFAIRFLLLQMLMDYLVLTSSVELA